MGFIAKTLFERSVNGINQVFTPNIVPGLEIWLDANDPSTLFDAVSGGSLPSNGGNVRRWQDKSGNGRHFIEQTLPPSRTVSVINNKDAVRFQSPSLSLIQRLTIIGGLLPQNLNNIFLVTRTSDTQYVFLGSNSTNGAYFDATQNNNGNAFGGDGVTISSYRVNTRSVSATRSALLTSRGANTALLSMVGISTVAASFANLQFNYPWELAFAVNDGYVCELLIYNGILSTGNRDFIESYLIQKWGIVF